MKLLGYSSWWPREPNTLQFRRTHANREKKPRKLRKCYNYSKPKESWMTTNINISMEH